MQWAERTIRAGVAEIKSKLSGLDLNWHRVRRRWSEVDAGPSFRSEHPKRQHFGSYQQESGYHQSHRSAGKISNLGAGLGVGEFPDKKGEKELRGQKRNAGFCHRVRILLVD